MTTYIDTSVLLRLAFGEPQHLAGWRELKRKVTSQLSRVEALRTLDRRRANGGIVDSDFAARRAFVLALLDGIDQVELSSSILDRAAEPFPTPLRTLDALHLATAVAVARALDDRLAFATHDIELGVGARAMGFTVLGV